MFEQKILVDPKSSPRAFQNAINTARSYLAKLEAIGTFGPSTPAEMLASVNDGIAAVQTSWAGFCSAEPVLPVAGASLLSTTAKPITGGVVSHECQHDNAPTKAAMAAMRP
jgi:hypothetical protein